MSEGAASNPVVVYISVAVLAIGLIIGATRSATSGIGAFLEAKRRVSSDKDDADIKERDRQIVWLTAELAARDAHIDRMTEWAWAAYHAMRAAGIQVQPPPPRFQPATPPTEGSTPNG